MSAKIISLTEYRELLQRIEDEAAETDPGELLNLYELDRVNNDCLIWLEIARSVVYPPLYCVQGGKK